MADHKKLTSICKVNYFWFSFDNLSLCQYIASIRRNKQEFKRNESSFTTEKKTVYFDYN